MGSYLKSIKEKYSYAFLTRIVLIIVFSAFILDINNIPSKYIVQYDFKINMIFAVLSMVLIITIMSELKLLNLISIKSINIVDAGIFVVLFSSVLFLAVTYVVDRISSYKYITILIVNTVIIVIMIIRAIRYSATLRKYKKFKSNVFDLKDIYDGKFYALENNMILMSEKDVDYDLLQRDNVIEKLFNSIILSKPDGRFVISLEGKWGSGKTTILNNVKSKLNAMGKDIVIIDEFDPWSYSDKESLFVNMFDIILKKTGYKYSTQNINSTINKFSTSIFGGSKNWLFTRNFTGNDDINLLKARINDYLRLSDKKVVFFIDNLDRINSENVILLFNSVANLLDFERITYVLSFDNSRVKSIFDNELGLDYQYLKKIIQLQIRVPEIDVSVLKNIYFTCLNNILRAFGENTNDMSSYELIIDNLCNRSLDIRDFKRFINSVISLPYSRNNYLYKTDLLIIEYIRLHNLTLFDKVLANRRFFISYDKEYDRALITDSMDSEKFSIVAKEFFNDLFSTEEHIEYIDMLAEIFPYVDRYKGGSILDHQSYNNIDYNIVAKNHRICSAKYFDLYFTKTSNDLLELGKQTNEFIKALNNAETVNDLERKYNETMSLLHTSYHKEFFERIMVYLNDINSNKILDFSILLIGKIHTIDNSAIFMGLSAKRRVEVIISEMLKRLDDYKFESFLNQIKSTYINIDVISNIVYWMESDKLSPTNPDRVEKIKEVCNAIAKEIIYKNINLYEKKYFIRGNIWAIYRNLIDEPELIRNYIKSVVNKNNIFRFLYDIIGLSHGSNYTYSISKENLEILTSTEELDILLDELEPKTEDQKFVMDVYNKFLIDGSDRWGKGGITIGTERVFNDL